MPHPARKKKKKGQKKVGCITTPFSLGRSMKRPLDLRKETEAGNGHYSHLEQDETRKQTEHVGQSQGEEKTRLVPSVPQKLHVCGKKRTEGGTSAGGHAPRGGERKNRKRGQTKLHAVRPKKGGKKTRRPYLSLQKGKLSHLNIKAKGKFSCSPRRERVRIKEGAAAKWRERSVILFVRAQTIRGAGEKEKEQPSAFGGGGRGGTTRLEKEKGEAPASGKGKRASSADEKR